MRAAMPRSLTERQALKAEVTEIRAQIAACWQELESGSPRRTRRESLEWRIRVREKRLEHVRARLAALHAEGP
jgi:hypothetical protein